VPQHQGHVSGPAFIASLEIGRVNPLPHGNAVVEPADPHGGFGQLLEVFWWQGFHRAGRAELLEGLVPGVTLKRLPAGSKLVLSAVAHRLILAVTVRCVGTRRAY
jgi:hypothetical protein